MTDQQLEELVARIGEEMLTRMGPREAPPPSCACSPAAEVPSSVVRAEVTSLDARDSGATTEQIQAWCDDAVERKMAAVGVLSCHVACAAGALHNSEARLAASVGWPNGAAPAPVRLQESELALASGAQEIEVVIPTGALLEGADDRLFAELKAFASLAHSADASLTAVVEITHLDETRLATAVALAFLAGVDAVAPAAGLTAHGRVDAASVRLCRAAAPDGAGVFVFSPDSAPADASEWLRAGADRIALAPLKAGARSL